MVDATRFRQGLRCHASRVWSRRHSLVAARPQSAFQAASSHRLSRAFCPSQSSERSLCIKRQDLAIERIDSAAEIGQNYVDSLVNHSRRPSVSCVVSTTIKAALSPGFTVALGKDKTLFIMLHDILILFVARQAGSAGKHREICYIRRNVFYLEHISQNG